MDKVINIKTLQETLTLGKKLGELLKPGMILTLSGDLGAGKTTFTKGIGQGLGIKRVINSPTFTILKQYQGKYMLSHFDVYRLEGQDSDLGFEEIFESDHICVIEWAQYIQNILPENRLEITIKRTGDETRQFVFHPKGLQYEQLLKELTL